MSSAKATGHILNASLVDALNDKMRDFATQVLTEKFSGQGIRLTKRERDDLHACVSTGEFGAFRLTGRRATPPQTIAISWTAKDSRRFDRALRNLDRQMPRIIRDQTDTLAKTILNKLRRRWRMQRATDQATLEAFRRRLRRRWHKPLDGFAMFLAITRDFSVMVGGPLQASTTAENSYLVAALVRLHARACQVADEILTLLRHGFADGAIARWRTLHEIAVVAMVLRERGNDAAERYLLHESIDDYKAMLLYQKHAKRLRLKPMTDAEVKTASDTHDALVVRFGKGFRSDYGWAAQTTTDEPKFDRLEASITSDHWRPYYRLASHNVHAGSKGILFKLGLAPGTDLLLTGPSNVGLADPGQNTVLTLNQISAALGTC